MVKQLIHYFTIQNKNDNFIIDSKLFLNIYQDYG